MCYDAQFYLDGVEDPESKWDEWKAMAEKLEFNYPFKTSQMVGPPTSYDGGTGEYDWSTAKYEGVFGFHSNSRFGCFCRLDEQGLKDLYRLADLLYGENKWICIKNITFQHVESRATVELKAKIKDDVDKSLDIFQKCIPIVEKAHQDNNKKLLYESLGWVEYAVRQWRDDMCKITKEPKE